MNKLELLTRQELIERAIVLWRKYNWDYRNLLTKYNELLEKKREMIKSGEMRKTRLDLIKKSELARYPDDIDFLNYGDEREAKRYIRLLANQDIIRIINQVEEFVDSALTQTLKSKIYDYDYQIRHSGDRRSIYGLNPDACKGKGKHSHHTQLSFTANLNVSEK